ncbi:hypothetical protein NXS19_012896 [Fusarium pseudograminearum]|nr:hypothetical protein FPSE5266_07056 [Fusarium pseudograminearum]UZP45084.1 hypothetical protein NXS19_012896 [Fusarium pseudograminearum]
MIAQSETEGELVMYTNGRQIVVSAELFLAPWLSSITYEHETGYLRVGSNPLCVMYEPSGRLAALANCQSVVEGQYRHLTCDPPSDAGLVCNIPAMRCDNGGCTDLGEIWNRFYLLGWDEDVWIIVIGADDLSTSDAPAQGIQPISMAIETV